MTIKIKNINKLALFGALALGTLAVQSCATSTQIHDYTSHPSSGKGVANKSNSSEGVSAPSSSTTPSSSTAPADEGSQGSYSVV